jgi:hypothetical protein
MQRKGYRCRLPIYAHTILNYNDDCIAHRRLIYDE